MRLLGAVTHLVCSTLLLGWCFVAWLLGAPGSLAIACCVLWTLLKVSSDRWTRGFWTITAVAAATTVWAVADGRPGWLALATAWAWSGLVGATAVLTRPSSGLRNRAEPPRPRGVSYP